MSNPVGAQRYGLGGGDAYYDAVKYGGYTGTREQFGRDQAEFAQNATAVAQAREEVERNTQTVVNTAQTFTEETVPAAIQSVEEKGDTEEDRLEARTTELVQSINTAGAVQVQAVEDEGTEQIGLVSDAGIAQVEAVEQAGSDQVDVVEQAGADQVQAVTDEGTTQVGAVTGEGDTQVQRVQDKGDEVLDSIPDDYTKLINAVGYNEITLTGTTGYINSAGEVKSGSSFRYTAYGTPIKKGDYLNFHARGYSNTVAMIYRCDSNGENRVPIIMCEDSEVHDFTYLCLEDGYIGFCWHTAVTPSAYITNHVAATEVYDILQDEIDDFNAAIYQTINGVITAHETGKIINLNGAIATLNSGSYSDPIPVMKGDIIQFTAYVNPAMTAISYCKSNLTGITVAVSGAAYNVQDYTLVSDRTGYIVVSYITASPHTLKILRPYTSQIALGEGSVSQLLGKKVVWCGDSHVLGSSFNDTKQGWRGRIAEACGCYQFNYAQGGACITRGVSQTGRIAVVDQIENAHTEHSDADFIIFDGGCNDADLIGNATGETKPEAYGTFSENDFSGNYDPTTFCGAMETICMRLSQYWLGKHVGYIVPHKQAVSNNYHAGHNNYRTYYETAIQICNKWGIQVLNLWDGCYLNPKHNWMCDTDNTMTNEEIYAAGFLYADRQHMTEAGYNFEAPIVNAWMHTI